MTRSWVRWGVIVVAIGFSVMSLLVLDGPANPFSVYRGGGAGMMFVLAECLIVVLGVVLLVVRPLSWTGLWMVGAGCAAWLPIWVGWGAVAPWLRTLAAAFGWFHWPLLAHALLAVSAARGGTIGGARRATARLLSVAYAAAAMGLVAQLFLANPYRDPQCWADCASNPFAMVERPTMFAVVWPVLLGLQAVVLAGVAAVLTWTAIGAKGRRGVLVTAVAAAGCGAVGVGMLTAAIGTAGTDDPALPLGRAAVGVVALSGLLVASTAIASLVQGHRRRLRLEEIAAGSPDGIESALRRALDDPTLSVAYWLPEFGRLADADGNMIPLPPTPDPARMVTRIVRGGHIVALVSHDADSAGSWDVGPALGLAIHNESLQAQGRAQLEALRERRMRIVERSDTHRRRLERDLHDGAQQLLIALAARLRTVAAAASNALAAGELEAAVEEARAAIKELRELAHGIFPAVLANDGLAAAIRSLALEAPLPVELGHLPVGRFGTGTEMAAYSFVTAAIGDAARRRATHVRVEADLEREAIIVSVADDADDPPTLSTQAADRVGAIDGAVVSSSDGVKALIPIRSDPSADSR